ncbi:forkhead box protein D1-like [Rana temporaria]|uniref:forkhead box protein D1-like n=1 Tax=Rana temporaria TaxID=8407 RepID=UPI001AAD0DE6|nr:forkhead box protein D1-like [Rana temporaria]
MSSSVNTTGASFLIEALMGWTSQPEEREMRNFGTLPSQDKSEERLYSNTGLRSRQSEEKDKMVKHHTRQNTLKPEVNDKRESVNPNIISQSETGTQSSASISPEEKILTCCQLKQKTVHSENNQHEEKNNLEKPNQSYIALISKAILSTPEKRLQLSDIYQWIMDTYPYYHNQDKSWRNSVRHNLSLNECFIKAGRSDNGKGHYWTVHPANMEAFSQGDYQRRRTRRRIRRVSSVLGCSPHLPLCNLPCANQRFCIWCPSLHVHSSLNQMWSLVENVQHQSQRSLAVPIIWPWHQLSPYI